MASSQPAVFQISGEAADMHDYAKVMGLRPPKLDQYSSNYHLAKRNEPRCDRCIHFFIRHIDAVAVCEIVRPVPEVEILPEATCMFQTGDGLNFPLYKEK